MTKANHLEAWLAQEQALSAVMNAGAGPGVASADQAASMTGLQFMQAMARGEVPYPFMAKTLDFGLVEVGLGHAVFQGTPGMAHLNPMGTIHGGWFATLLDSALGCAVHTRMAVGQACRDAGLALLPGVATGSEIMMAQEDGFTELKFFPAMQAGGPAMLKAWSGPFFDVKFCPTGGVTLQNAPDFLALPNVICVGGSWIVPADAFAAGDWARVTQLAKDTQGLRK